ncbi:MAG: ABC transporter permease [Flavobacteriales bacterium]|nr:ABC transporter permease [Flavobacteriales bacterium]
MAARPLRQHVRTSTTGTILGIALVLFMLGSLGFLLLNARVVQQWVKENLRVEVFLKRGVKEADIMQLRKELDMAPFTRGTAYVTSEEAAARLKQDLGEDFLGVLGYNPLLASIELGVSEAYAVPDSLDRIVGWLQKDPRVHEVKYNRDVVAHIDANMRKIGLLLLGFSALLLVVAVALINNTIRLAIYAKRYLIRTMHLVGATSWFIKRPFLGQSIWQGLIAATLAVAGLLGVVRLLVRLEPDLEGRLDPVLLAALFGGVVLLGLVISLAATWFAVRRYLRMNIDDLNWS